jgi:hypothetical protein
MVVLTREGLDMFPLDRCVLAIDLIFHSVQLPFSNNSFLRICHILQLINRFFLCSSV